MRFTIPKFIEHEARIIGPFTFKQFIYVGSAGGIAFFIYLLASFPVFILSAIILLSCAMILAFVKIEGRPLPTILKDFFSFSSSPKLYIWERKNISPKIFKEEENIDDDEKEKKAEEPPLIINKSKLKGLSTQIETKTK